MSAIGDLDSVIVQLSCAQMNPFPSNAALLLVDLQKGFDAPSWGRRNNPRMESRVIELLGAWRESKRPVIHAKRRGLETLVIAGLTTNHCVSTTARMAGNLGFNAWVVSDATATFDRIGPDGVRYSAEQIQAIALSDLHGEFSRFCLIG